MKVKFETCYRALMLAMLILLCWSVWSSYAQTTATNSTSESTIATNKIASVLVTGSQLDASNITPGWVEHLAKEFPALKWKWWGNELWKYFASLIYIFLAFYVSKFLDYLTRVWLRRWAEKTETKFDDLLLELLNGPVKVVAFVIFLHIGLSVFHWPDKVQVILSKGFTIVVAFTLTYMVMKFIDLLMGYWRQRALADSDRTFDEQLFPIVRKSLKVFITVVAVLVTAQNLQINVTAALTSLSIGGLAIGLAAQDTLANLFGAIAVFVDKPFRLGDRIQIDAVEGNVEAIGMRSTRVRNAKGFLVTIPNKTVGSATITNISKRPSIQTEMNIGLTYDTSTEKIKRAIALLSDIYRAHPLTGDLLVSFNRFADSSLNILVVHFAKTSDVREYLAAMQDLNLKVKEQFDKEGISFAFPSQTLYLKQDSSARVSDGAGPMAPSPK